MRTKLLSPIALIFALFPTPDLGAYDGPPPEIRCTTNMVEHKGTAVNIFFHPLIAWTDLAFSHDKKNFTYIDEWFVTVNEFKEILEQMYERNYVLMDIYDIVDPQTLKPRTFYLPQGKIPVVLSVDDFNYYDTMRSKGTNHKMLVDGQGSLKTWTKRPDGSEVLSDDNEVPLIVENFVRQHPDFSIHGGRGIIAFTGYHGLFGYRFNNHQTMAEERDEAKKVADKLKSLGWRMASHSWSHKMQEAIPEDRFEREETWWLEEVTPILGPTDLYITPFGSPLEPYKDRMKWLFNHGFHFIFNVGYNSTWRYDALGVHMDRIPIDGRGFRTKASALEKLFNIYLVFDPARPLLPKDKLFLGN